MPWIFFCAPCAAGNCAADKILSGLLRIIFTNKPSRAPPVERAGEQLIGCSPAPAADDPAADRRRPALELRGPRGRANASPEPRLAGYLSVAAAKGRRRYPAGAAAIVRAWRAAARVQPS